MSLLPQVQETEVILQRSKLIETRYSVELPEHRYDDSLGSVTVPLRWKPEKVDENNLALQAKTCMGILF